MAYLSGCYGGFLHARPRQLSLLPGSVPGRWDSLHEAPATAAGGVGDTAQAVEVNL